MSSVSTVADVIYLSFLVNLFDDFIAFEEEILKIYKHLRNHEYLCIFFSRSLILLHSVSYKMFAGFVSAFPLIRENIFEIRIALKSMKCNALLLS